MSQSVTTAADSKPAARSRPGIDHHPLALYVLFATEMWERFGFYTLAAVMTLFLQDKVQGFGWTREQATDLWSYYLMFVYMTPFLGGLIADQWIGYRRSILIGGVVFIAGYLMLAMGSLAAFYAALVMVFIGNGFFKPNISTIVGNFYPAGSPLRDAAYNIFYMGINVGAFLAPIVVRGPSAEDRLPGRVLLGRRGDGDRHGDLQRILSIPGSWGSQKAGHRRAADRAG